MLADRAYANEAVIKYCKRKKIEIVIPPKRNRKHKRGYDKDIYENRYQVEKCFLRLKGWLGIVKRYAKNTSSYVATIQISCVVMRLNIL